MAGRFTEHGPLLGRERSRRAEDQSAVRAIFEHQRVNFEAARRALAQGGQGAQRLPRLAGDGVANLRQQHLCRFAGGMRRVESRCGPQARGGKVGVMLHQFNVPVSTPASSATVSCQSPRTLIPSNVDSGASGR